MSEKNSVVVLTRKSLESFFRVGGTGDWRAQPAHVNRCKYVIALRNGNDEDAEDAVAHGTAFMIGRGLGTIPADDRVIITFAEYAEIDVPNRWKKNQRNPVLYEDAAAFLGIENLDGLDWQPFPTDQVRAPEAKPLTLEEARMGLAAFFKVPPGNIDITIRG